MPVLGGLAVRYVEARIMGAFREANRSARSWWHRGKWDDFNFVAVKLEIDQSMSREINTEPKRDDWPASVFGRMLGKSAAVVLCLLGAFYAYSAYVDPADPNILVMLVPILSLPLLFHALFPSIVEWSDTVLKGSNKRD
ncbi:hypothetical protein HME9302_00108 [Alteripontixanthobacter maritimus]|uniref:Uncharacterized protein n=1 Tax=Alteripontixanthobacter maritimus TaxID=2161824 RepID=A0A369Q338_9SPHN|nr:hypothetical protein [Alteripontixanthobacter maritimus]RDC58932.1 hypothetical protein HME9302_00108 [Alteripontixanthobacter maritimus]